MNSVILVVLGIVAVAGYVFYLQLQRTGVSNSLNTKIKDVLTGNLTRENKLL